jgi:glycogen operon protein
MVSKMACRFLGSPDVFEVTKNEAEQSLNFITCHDGFTLNDLVSYNHKHNEANGENNRDGMDDNLSWNCGIEGPTDDPAIEQLRNRQVKNFLVFTLLSLGTPMLMMGDEVRRTQHGNNNAYCQDNELSWLDWGLLQKHADIRRFVKELIGVRLNRDRVLALSGLNPRQIRTRSRIQFHGVKLNQPDWGQDSHSLALTAYWLDGKVISHLILNAYWEPLDFELPSLPVGHQEGWYRWLDTFLASPDDITRWSEAPKIQGSTYLVQPRSIVGLVALSSEES